MSAEHAHLNRPVHLARRDVLFEHAVKLLGLPLTTQDTATRLGNAEIILACLTKAREHASFALRSHHSLERETDFLHFLELVTDHVVSAHAMIQHQVHLEEEESFLCQFLGVDRQQSRFPAMHYQRRSEDIHHELWHLFGLAQQPYAALRQANIEAMNEEERSRYERAYKNFREEAAAKYGQDAAASGPA
jgi:hypothetical protein